MQFRTVAVIAVALLVALSGCSALGGSQADEPSSESDTESLTENETGTNGSDDGETEPDDTVDSNGTEDDANTDDGNSNTDDGDANTDDGSVEDDTANAEWTPPEEPNRKDGGGLEDKREDRIESVEFVDKTPAERGDGYSNFNLEVTANTSMENVDPPEHGDVIGEPYFFVKINEDEQKLVERTGQVRMDENGTYHIDVRPAGIEEFGAGPLTVEVFLMDEDKEWDDIYDSVGREIQYNPDGSADGSNSTTDESEPSEN
ncbi:hypothetical protein [Natrinema amylolyticum]|uniref:hypothetical protein n=1 Tax=Natrinema amylolyticum TaxID=2878679 RepID=UPI001CFA7F78|nr:hypothetical protein [Natrinema amylolyticum]